jgi:hypothetical protein
VKSLLDAAGEMVLILHWSLLNFAAVMKILKKHGTSAPHFALQRAATMRNHPSLWCVVPCTQQMGLTWLLLGCRQMHWTSVEGTISAYRSPTGVPGLTTAEQLPFGLWI